jgi:hypothetical protein
MQLFTGGHENVKGTVSRDLRPSVFSLNGTPGSPDLRGFEYRFEFSDKSDSIRLRKSTPRNAAQRGVETKFFLLSDRIEFLREFASIFKTMHFSP